VYLNPEYQWIYPSLLFGLDNLQNAGGVMSGGFFTAKAQGTQRTAKKYKCGFQPCRFLFY
jgi:hypothetical protein